MNKKNYIHQNKKDLKNWKKKIKNIKINLYEMKKLQKYVIIIFKNKRNFRK